MSGWRPQTWLNRSWVVGALLPIVGAGFWLITGWVDQQVLGQPHATTETLKAEGQHQVQLALTLTIVSIDAEIDRRTNITEVSIRTIGSPLEEMEFKFPVTEFAEVEAAIAQELNLAQPEIQKLIRYRIDE